MDEISSFNSNISSSDIEHKSYSSNFFSTVEKFYPIEPKKTKTSAFSKPLPKTLKYTEKSLKFHDNSFKFNAKSSQQIVDNSFVVAKKPIHYNLISEDNQQKQSAFPLPNHFSDPTHFSNPTHFPNPNHFSLPTHFSNPNNFSLTNNFQNPTYFPSPIKFSNPPHSSNQSYFSNPSHFSSSNYLPSVNEPPQFSPNKINQINSVKYSPNSQK